MTAIVLSFPRHTVQNTEASRPARAKALGLGERGNRSGDFHAAQHAASPPNRNADPQPISKTVRVVSQVREFSFPESARVFTEALNETGYRYKDVAAALDISAPIVGRWCNGAAVIPADCIWALLRRLPVLGLRLLVMCANQLDTRSIEQMVAHLQGIIDARAKGAR